MAKIQLHDLNTDLSEEVAAMDGQLVGKLAAVLQGTTKAEKVAALAVVVNYFKITQGMDMEKFHALLRLCDATEDGTQYTTGHSGPPGQA